VSDSRPIDFVLFSGQSELPALIASVVGVIVALAVPDPDATRRAGPARGGERRGVTGLSGRDPAGAQVLIAPGRVNAQITHTLSAISTIAQSS